MGEFTTSRILRRTHDMDNKAFRFLTTREAGILRGEEFRLFRTMDISAGTSKMVQAITGALSWVIFGRSITVNSYGIVLRIFEGPFDTITNGETVLTPINSNRILAETSSLQIFADPTGITGGLQLDEIRLPGVDPTGQRHEVTPIITEGLVIYRPHTQYVIEFANIRSSGAINVHVNWVWQESEVI